MPLRSVRPTAEPSRVEVPREAQIAGAIGATAQGLDAFARERDRLDDIRVQEAEVQYRTEIADLFQGEDGLLTKRGTKAAEAWDGVTDGLRTRGSAAEATLSTDRQRMLFARRREALSQDAAGRARLYVDGEIRRAHTEQFNALNAMDLDRVSANPDVAETAIREADERVALYGQSNGTDGAEITRQRHAMRSGLRAAQLTALANTENPEAIARAQELFAREQGTMTDRDRQEVKRALDAGTVLTQSAAQEARIHALHPDDETAAVEEAGKIENIAVRDATVSRLLARYSRNTALANRADEKVLERTLETVERTGSLEGVSASDLATLQRKGWLDNVQGRAAQVRNGNPPVTDRRAMSELYAHANAGTLKDVVLPNYVSRLNSADYRMWEQAIQEAKTGNNGKTNIALTSQDRDLYIFDVARELRLLPDNDVEAAGQLNDDDATEYEALRDRARLSVEEMERDKGRNLTSPEIRNAIRLGFATLKAEQATADAVGAAQRAAVPRAGPGTMARFQMGRGQSGRVAMPAVPLTADERAQEDWDGYVARLKRNFSFTQEQAVEAADRAFGIRP